MQLLAPQDVLKAANLLKQGMAVAFPTETVYGLGARVFDTFGVEKIFRMKGRPSDNPLICHIALLTQLPLLAREIPAQAFKLAAHFWPGPLTLILKKHPRVPSCVTGGGPTVAVRMPRHPVALELIQQVGEPLVAPSANKSGRPSSTTAEHVLADFKDMEGAVLDGGRAEGGLESTVLYVAEGEPCILRPGPITPEAIAQLLQVEVKLGSREGASPGTKYRHYAPQAPIQIVDSLEEALAFAGKAFLMSTDKLPGFYHLTAQSLYALLRQADQEQFDTILALCTRWNDDALKDRLLRAAGMCG